MDASFGKAEEHVVQVGREQMDMNQGTSEEGTLQVKGLAPDVVVLAKALSNVVEGRTLDSLVKGRPQDS